MAEKTLEQTIRFAAMVAAKQGWVVNPEQDFIETVLAGLVTNYNRHGYYLCPCRDSEGSRQLDATVICPCGYARPDIEEFGHCFCALFLSSAFAASGRSPAGIPDRRVN
ncbi:MAG: ferredoxin:thioredoxin reductase [Spirochaetes bacterium GWD1_61_31]|nr:MAG: ferredoxin:thioredoxin reductase [Spirochaetes bacterium GWB1_60_80]OHD30095.1 MAG: ferredoxin:thioredoxin reductase [Spirochaetes bacterium GWC1_61_12]OHD34654.1 MAG: ferredoxin:thioredoxin reductase [Spirochaetes bacterium GWD1_61_31]OHD46470.1 MAG: ferredoxin:thioredoxin reductase [Spirochaetes bacterium GWE1_60_18]OHD59525.1 MAG: ferredoxin:thioredoxin reductase [Spirochaetes bacterium GWF1_60_12]HAW85777.1 ferredoxin:thioredoxin reductase [Spirochaetaceae bacterium]